jgi:hypothetical protein
MRKSIVVFIGLLFHFIGTRPGLMAQSTFETAIKPAFNGTLNKIIYDAHGAWMASGYYGVYSGSYNPNCILRFDSLGNTVWITPILVNGWAGHTPGDLIKTTDGNFVVTGESSGCDVSSGVGFIQKISPAGLLIWSREYRGPLHSWGVPFSTATELKNAGLLLSADSSIFRAGSGGDSVWSKNCHHGTILSVIENARREFILGTNTGVLKTDSSGVSIGFYPFPYPVKSVQQLSDSSYVFLSGLNLIHTDTSFTVLNSASLSADFNQVKVCKRNAGNYWILGRAQGTNVTKLKGLNPFFQNLNSFTFADSAVVAQDLGLTDSLLAIAGYEKAGKDYYSSNISMFAKSFQYSGNNLVHLSDAGVSSLNIDSVYWVHNTGFPPDIYDIHFRVTAVVKNYGWRVLHEVYLNSVINFIGGICDNLHYHGLFSGLNVLPGDSVYLLVPGYLDNTDLTLTGTDPLSSLCFWTSAPDGYVDKGHSNDACCTSFVIPFHTGINDTYQNAVQVKVMPNPNTGIFSLSFSTLPQNAELEIYSPQGKCIYSSHLTREQTELDLQTEAKGFYFYVIKSGKIIDFRGKIVLQ